MQGTARAFWVARHGGKVAPRPKGERRRLVAPCQAGGLPSGTVRFHPSPQSGIVQCPIRCPSTQSGSGSKLRRAEGRVLKRGCLSHSSTYRAVAGAIWIANKEPRSGSRILPNRGVQRAREILRAAKRSFPSPWKGSRSSRMGSSLLDRGYPAPREGGDWALGSE
jgi:hypothetical protein